MKKKNISKLFIKSSEASKTNESCLMFNKSEDYLIMGIIIIAAIFCMIYFCISGKFEYIPYCIATVIICFILIYIMHKCMQYRINRFIENNKSNFIYRIDGKIYELEQGTKKEWFQLKCQKYYFIVLTNQFSVTEYGVAYVIRNKSILSDPDAKIYTEQSCSEEISIFYDQITEIKTRKILTTAELKQFLKAEEIISGNVEEKRHSFRISVKDSLYKAIKYHAVERSFTTAGAAEDILEKSVLYLPIIYDLHADEETNTVNNIKYYLEEIKKDVKSSLLMVHDESYSHVAEDFISFLEPLSSNPMSCFNSGNLAIIEKECMNILLAAYDAGLGAGIYKFPLIESYFYRFLHLCRRGVEK